MCDKTYIPVKDCRKVCSASANAKQSKIENCLEFLVLKCTRLIQRGSGHLRQAGAPKGTLHVDGTEAGYGLRSS